MAKSKPRIFHGLVNYGTQAGMFAKGLREAGFDAFSVTIADKSKRLIDHELKHGGNIFQKIINRCINIVLKINWFFKYDIFHFYYGKSMFKYNIDLLFYKLFNKKVVMEYLGHDVDLCLGMNGVDYRGRKCDRLKKIKRLKLQSKLVDRQLVCAPYYHQFVDNSIILPLAIDLESYSYSPLILKDDAITIMHCPTDRAYKKSNIIESAIHKLIEEGYKINYKCITNVTHSKLKEEYITSDIVIDQLNPWYGTVSIEAMALGRPVVCGYQQHLMLYDYETYKNIPIINANISDIYIVLKHTLDNKINLPRIGLESRKYVEDVHDLKKLSNKLIDLYESI